MALPVNALTKISGDGVDNPLLPIFTNSDISGDFGAGLLMDIDFSDPEGAGGYSGSWAAGDKLLNSAWEHVVRRLIPTATKDSLSMTIGGSFASNQIVIQRTGKGYPHIVVSQVNDAVANQFYFAMPAAVLTYLLANPAHQYRLSIEEYITRSDTFTGNSGNAEAVIHKTSASTGVYLARIEGLNSSSGGFRPNVPVSSGGKQIAKSALPDLGTTTGAHYKSVGAAGWTGDPTGAVAADLTARWQWGPIVAAGLHLSRSSIARRLVLEDMTVSQAALTAAIGVGSLSTESQLFAGCDVRHQAIWTARVASDDYYHGDTFNTPASVLA